MDPARYAALESSAEAEPRALAQLRALAFVAPRPFPRDALDGDLAAHGDWGELVYVAGDEVTMPAEVQEAIRSTLDQEDERVAVAVAAKVVREAFPEDSGDPRQWPRAVRLVDHARAVTDHAERTGAALDEAVAILERVGDYLASCGDSQAAERVLTRALALADRTDRVGNELRAQLHRDLAKAHATVGRVRSELHDLERAVELLAASPDSSAVAVTQAELARRRAEAGEHLAARAALDPALAKLNRLRGREAAQVERALASVLLSEGKPEEARAVAEAALEAAQGTLGPDHPDLAEYHHDLARVLIELGDPGARTALERSLAVEERALGPDHPLVAIARSNLSDVLTEQGDPRAAVALLEKALANAIERDPPEEAAACMRHVKLAHALRKLGDDEAAHRHAEDAAKLAERAFEPDDRRHRHLLASIAEIFRESGDLIRARDLYARALELANRAVPDHAEVATFAISLGNVLAALGDATGALTTYVVAKSAQEALHGPRDSRVAELRLILAHLAERLAFPAAEAYATLGDLERGDALRESARTAFLHELQRELDATEDPEVLVQIGATCVEGGEDRLRDRRVREIASTALLRASAGEPDDGLRGSVGAGLQVVGAAYRDVGELDRARELYEAALPFLDEPSHRATALAGLASIQAAAGDTDQALEMLRSSAEEQRSRHDRNGLTATLHALGRVLEASGSYDEALEAYSERVTLLRGLPDLDPRVEGVTLHDLGDVQRALGRLPEAVELYEQAVERKRAGGSPPSDLRTTLVALGRARVAVGDREAALAAYEEALKVLRSLPERDEQGEGVVLHDIADVHVASGDADEAASLYGEAAELKRASGSPRDRAITLQALARTLGRLGRFDEALAAQRERLAAVQGDGLAEARALEEIAGLQRQLGNLDAAVDAYMQSAELLRGENEPQRLAGVLAEATVALIHADEPRAAGILAAETEHELRGIEDVDSLQIGRALVLRGQCAFLEKDPATTIRLSREGLGHLEGDARETLADESVTWGLIADAHNALGDTGAAEEARERAESMIAAHIEESSGDAPRLLELAELAIGAGALAAAERAADRAAREVDGRAAGDPEPGRVAAFYRELGDDYHRRKDRDSAVRSYDAAVGLLAGNPARASLLLGRGLLEHEAGRLDEAASTYREGLSAAREAADADPQLLLLALGRVLQDAGRLDEAHAAFEELLALLRSADEPDPTSVGVALHDLANVEAQRGRLAEALRLYREAVEHKRQGDDPRDLATTLVYLARHELWLGGDDRAERAAAEAAAVLTGLRGDDADAAAGVLPSPDGEEPSESLGAADVLTTLSPAALAELARYPRAVDSATRPQAGGERPLVREATAGTADVAAGDELLGAGIVEPWPGRAGLTRLTARGSAAVRLLTASGELPAGLAERLEVRPAEAADSLLIQAYMIAREELFDGDVAAVDARLDAALVASDDAVGPEAAVVAGLATLAAEALGRAPREDDAAVRRLTAAVEDVMAARDGDAHVSAAMACVDAGRLEEAGKLLEAGEALIEDVASESATGAQLGLAWRWLGLAYESRGDGTTAVARYRNAVRWLPTSAARQVLLDAAERLRLDGELDAAAELARAVPMAAQRSEADLGCSVYLRVSRAQALVGRRVHARATAAEAADAMRQWPGRIGPAKNVGDGAEALASLGAPAVAMLERLRRNEVQGRLTGVEPGMRQAATTGAVSRRACDELRTAGLLERTAPPGWQRLTDLGSSAARLLAGEGAG